MAFGDYDGPNKANKGHEGGACNRTRCQAEPALHYNHGSYSWYCADCARDIGDDVVNKRNWNLRWLPKLGHPMFETRAEIDQREAMATPPVKSLDESLREIVAPVFGWPRDREKLQSASLARMLKRARRAS